MGCQSSKSAQSTSLPKSLPSSPPTAPPPATTDSDPIPPLGTDPTAPKASQRNLIQFIQQVSIDPLDHEHPVARLSTPPRSTSPKLPHEQQGRASPSRTKFITPQHSVMSESSTTSAQPAAAATAEELPDGNAKIICSTPKVEDLPSIVQDSSPEVLSSATGTTEPSAVETTSTSGTAAAAAAPIDLKDILISEPTETHPQTSAETSQSLEKEEELSPAVPSAVAADESSASNLAPVSDPDAVNTPLHPNSVTKQPTSASPKK
jgi:hypothetical protein